MVTEPFITDHVSNSNAEKIVSDFQEIFDWTFSEADKRALKELAAYAFEQGHQNGYETRREGK